MFNILKDGELTRRTSISLISTLLKFCCPRKKQSVTYQGMPIVSTYAYLLRLALDSSTDGFHSLLFSPCLLDSSGDLISENRFSKPIYDERRESQKKGDY